jgi:hypothetical protein
MQKIVVTLNYSELPLVLSEQVEQADFLSGYSTSDENILIWVINRASGKQKELEFFKLENRFLSREEREKKLPKPSKKILPKVGVEVLQYYSLEPETDVLYEKIDIFSLKTNEKVTQASQIYFISYKNTLEELVKAAIKKYEFPCIYASWDDEEKVNYWVEVLYRIRRQTGESGGKEDSVFDQELINNMFKVDAKISKIIPTCIKRLAAIEQQDEQKLFSAFLNRTGFELTS